LHHRSLRPQLISAFCDVDHRLKTAAAPSVDQRDENINNEGEKEDVIQAEIHSSPIEIATVTEYTIIHGSPKESTPSQPAFGSRIENRLAASNLPNIPRDSPRVHRSVIYLLNQSSIYVRQLLQAEACGNRTNGWIEEGKRWVFIAF
jgi:hypothetical protein